MVATATTFGGAQSRYLVRYTPGPSTSGVYKVPAGCGSAGGTTSAGDGAVWVTCGSNRVIRVTASGAMRLFSLSRVTSVGHLAAGKAGAMWAVAYNSRHAAVGLVRITSGGASWRSDAALEKALKLASSVTTSESSPAKFTNRCTNSVPFRNNV